MNVADVKDLWQQLDKLNTSAARAAVKRAWLAIRFMVTGRGSASVALAGVRQGTARTALIAAVTLSLVLGLALNVLLDTLGAYYLERMYVVAAEDGLEYLLPQAAALLVAAMMISTTVFLCTQVTHAWIGKREIAAPFWITLCVPATLAFSLLSLAWYGLPFVIPAPGFDLLPPPLDSWLVFFMVIVMTACAMIAFARLASKRFSAAFAVTASTPKARMRFYLAASVVFMTCFVGAIGVGEAFKRVRGNPVADGIRVGGLQPVAATLMGCERVESAIMCAVTVWPEKFQQYTAFGPWVLTIETQDANLKKVVSGTIAWSPIQQGRVLPWVPMSSTAPVDLLLRADRKTVCALSHKPGSSVRLDVVARATTSRLRQRSQLRVHMVNGAYVLEALGVACA